MYEFAKHNKVFYLFIEPSYTTVCIESAHGALCATERSGKSHRAWVAGPRGTT